MYIEESFENNGKFTVNLAVNLKKYSGSLNLLSLTNDNKAFIANFVGEADKITRILVLLFYHLKLDFVDVFKEN